MGDYSAAILIALVVIAFLIAFCAYALGVALLYRLPPENPARPFINRCVEFIYWGMRVSSYIIAPTAAIWGVWLLSAWIQALANTGAQG